MIGYDSIIIEHPTRGVFRRFDPEEIIGVHSASAFHFSVTGLRSDPEYSFQFMSIRSAAKLWAMMPLKLRDGCHILARETGKAEYKTVI